MNEKEIFKSQYSASLEMLRQATLKCPDSLWFSSEYKNQFWQIAYHAIFYTHLYLHPTEQAFIPWEKHKKEIAWFEESKKVAEYESPYTKEDILAYLELCLEQMPGHLDALDFAAESGFDWIPFNKFQLQIYNIRHLQHHTGELCERLGAVGDIEVAWVGMMDS